MDTRPPWIFNIQNSLVRTVPNVVRRLFANARRAIRLFGATTMSKVLLAWMTRYLFTVTHVVTPILGHTLHLIRQRNLSRNWTS